CGVVRELGQGDESLSQFPCRLQLSPKYIKAPRGPQRWNELGSLTELPAQFECTAKDCFHFWDSKASREHQWQTKGDLQCEFLVRAFGGVRQGFEQLQSPGEMTDRLHIGRALARALSGFLPVRNSLLLEPRFGVMVSQQFRLGLDCLGKLLLQDLSNLLMQLLAAALQQRLIGRVLNQRMF